MKNLLATLHDCDPGMLPALAEIWSVDSKSLSNDELIRQLQRAMLDPSQAETAWDKLDEPARTALQLLVSSAQSRMKVGQFERFYGEIRKLGRAQIKREQPHLQGQSLAETLYYRGFIGEGFDKVDEHLIGFIYVPTDLIEALPLHKTSFGELAAESAPNEDELPRIGLVDGVDEVIAADTSIVDDMTTLLALLQAEARQVEGERFVPAAAEAIKPMLLRPSDARLAFMLGAGLSADLIARDEDKAQPSRNRARAWLEASRAEQIHALARAWLDSQNYRDMWHIPGLYPEDSGWSYDAAAARKAVIELLADLLPEQGWVSINDLIEIIKEFEPDFQRLDGDYDQWYIRNDAGEISQRLRKLGCGRGLADRILYRGPDALAGSGGYRRGCAAADRLRARLPGAQRVAAAARKDDANRSTPGRPAAGVAASQPIRALPAGAFRSLLRHRRPLHLHA